MSIPHKLLAATLYLSLALLNTTVQAERMDNYRIAKRGTADLKYPAWFKESFLDLRDDLAEAKSTGKRGILVFFSQKACQHCQAFLDTTLQEQDISSKVQQQYDVIGLDIFNDIEVTGIDGIKKPVRDFAESERARFTPTLIFYGIENKRLLRIVGFYPPEKFREVLAYIDGNHFSKMKLGEYLRQQTAQTSAPLKADYTLFAKPPHNLKGNLTNSNKPLVIIFSRGGCAACERFDERILGDKEIRKMLGNFHAVQLDRGDGSTNIIDSKGRTTTPKQWTGELELSYEPSILFFDRNGNEVHRLDSEVGRYRVLGSMEYVLAKGYEQYSQYQRWRRDQLIKQKQSQ